MQFINSLQVLIHRFCMVYKAQSEHNQELILSLLNKNNKSKLSRVATLINMSDEKFEDGDDEGDLTEMF